MQTTNENGWAVSVYQPMGAGVTRKIIAIFSAEHNAKFYVEKTYKKSLYLKPEIHRVKYDCEPCQE